LTSTHNGHEYQVGQSDLENFETLRGQTIKERQHQAPPPSAQLVVGELEQERLHQDLQHALEIVEQQAARIERQAEMIAYLADEKGRFEGENAMLRQQVAALQAERSQGIIARVLRFLLGSPRPQIDRTETEPRP
jgi:hypothetical protein